MLKIICVAVIVAVSVQNTDAAKYKVPTENVMQVYNLYQQVYTPKKEEQGVSKPPKIPKPTKPPKPEKTKKPPKPEKTEKPKPPKPEKTEKPKPPKPEKTEKPPKTEKPYSTEKPIDLTTLYNDEDEDEDDELYTGPTTIEPSSEWYPQGRRCSLFVDEHMQEVVYATQIMIDAPNITSFIDTCESLRETVNEDIYVAAYTSALIYRQDTQGISIPPIAEIIPYWFVPANAIYEAVNQTSQNTTEQTPVVVDYDYENGTESCLAYFREDILINSNHWIWHVLYNLNLAMGQAKDRQGELFYYLHQQILARYDAERFTCGLPRVLPFPSFYSPIPESYYPNLLSGLSGNFYSGRDSNLVLKDVPDSGIVISEQDVFYQRCIDASTSRTYRTRSDTYELLPNVSLLGSITESNAQSPNRPYYGSIHNAIHVALSRITNADIKDAPPGVIAFTSTAMRDPVFYEWHKTIDNIFATYSTQSTQYTAADLQLNGIVISNVYVQGASSSKNTLETYRQERMVNISQGVDFSRLRAVLIRVRHLQHEEFTHCFDITNNDLIARNVTIRIYLAPKTDYLGKDIPFSEQRRLFINLDVFTLLVPPGTQTIKRTSSDSSVTIPTQLSFEQLELQVTQQSTTRNLTEVPSRCLCGWPDTHLIPRGTEGGTTYDYFVMASDGSDYSEPSSPYCTSAPAYCGIWNAPYPDKKSMGYPWDRAVSSSITSIAQFASYSNMKTCQVVIKYSPTKLIDEYGAVIIPG